MGDVFFRNSAGNEDCRADEYRAQTGVLCRYLVLRTKSQACPSVEDLVEQGCPVHALTLVSNRAVDRIAVAYEPDGKTSFVLSNVDRERLAELTKVGHAL